MNKKEILNDIYLVGPSLFADLKRDKRITAFVATTNTYMAYDYYKQYSYPPFSTGDKLAYYFLTSMAQYFRKQPHQFILAGQPHSNVVCIINNDFLIKPFDQQVKIIQSADAMITNVPDMFLCLRTADCLPVLLYDPVHQAIGAAHCGWRGIVKHLAAHTAVKMNEIYGTQLEDLQVAFAPCISMRNYEIGNDVVEAMQRAKYDLDDMASWMVSINRQANLYSSVHLSLQAATAYDLMKVGVAADNIRYNSLCTYDNNSLFSVRRDGERTGRILSGICLNHE